MNGDPVLDKTTVSFSVDWPSFGLFAAAVVVVWLAIWALQRGRYEGDERH